MEDFALLNNFLDKFKNKALPWIKTHPLYVGIAIVSVLVIIVISLALSVISLDDDVTAPVQSDTSASASVSDESIVQDPFDPTAFVGTVLPETDPADISYAEDTLFLGDSNTVRMMSYADVTGVTMDNGFGIVGMGIQSFESMGVAQFEGISGLLTMPEIVELMQPQRVVITFGSNNIGMNIDTFIDYYKDALDSVKEAYPYTDIIIGAIFPVDQYRQNTSLSMNLINEMNTELVELARNEDVKFLNWFEPLYDEEIGYSKFESTVQDGVHLSRIGMEAIFDYFLSHSYITEDDRPMPLDPIPDRIGTDPAIVKNDPTKVPGPIDWSTDDEEETAAAQMVTVVFSAWDDSSGTSGGGSVSMGSASVVPGGATASVTATPASGYSFSGWRLSSGAAGSTGSQTISVLVDAGVTPGSTLTATAVFTKTQTQVTPPSSTSTPSSSTDNSTDDTSTGGDGGSTGGDGGSTGGDSGTTGGDGGSTGGDGGTTGGDGGSTGGDGGTTGGDGGTTGGDGGTTGGDGGTTGGDGGTTGGDGGTTGGDGGTTGGDGGTTGGDGGTTGGDGTV